MDYTFSTAGALIGLGISIFLIIRKVHPAYSLIAGALIGGLIGSGDLVQTVSTMVSGASSMMSSVLRILTSGILAGALIKTGSAEKIAEAIVNKLGQKRAIIALSISTMIICAVGVFIDIAVITVAPIAIAIGRKAKLSKPGILLAMIGGGKAGNIISPNPNTIAAAEGFGVDMTSLMIQNIVPKKGIAAFEGVEEDSAVSKDLPNFFTAILGPLAVIILLALRPLFGITVDPLIALPIGGFVTILVTGNARHTVSFTEFGISKVIGVSILLIGTGTIAGIIKASALQFDLINILNFMNMPAFLLAPLSGILMAGATASTTAGSTIAAQTFAIPLINAGVPAISAAAMTHAGATVIDSLPHGSFFHATGGSVFMEIKERMKLIPYEAIIGLTSTVASVIIYLIFG